MVRVVLHVDFDYFYAQCEENSNPAIRGKPVVVCVYSGRTEDSGVVSTCNYEARNYGVKAGIPIARAKKLLETKNAVFLPMNRAHYEEISDRIMEILEPLGDKFERVGIDEAYLELTSKPKGDFQQATQMSSTIKQLVVEQEHVTCSIGIAPNKLLAKIASDRNKPNGLTVVRPEDVVRFLGELPVSSIPGVGRKTEERLEQLEAKTINQLATLKASVLRETFGSSLGGYLYRAARGDDDEPVEAREQPTQFSRIATLKRNTHDISEILPLLKDLAHSATRKLNEKGMSCRTISIIAILSDLGIHSKSKTLESTTSDEKTIEEASEELMKQFLEFMPAVTVRRVGVRLSALAAQSGQTDISKFLG